MDRKVDSKSQSNSVNPFDEINRQKLRNENEPAVTTSTGMAVTDNQNSLTVGPLGPILLQDVHLLDKLGHFDRERIPERVVHAKGGGAFGYFEVTKDVTMYTKAKFLNKVGKRTPVFMRMSTVGGEKGSADSVRDPRGFAIKHYTEDGNYDMVGNNTPLFFHRDPSKFPDFIHTQKRNPASNLKDPNHYWDFPSLVPEAIHQFMFMFTDRGTPRSFRFMSGFSSHTWKWVNEQGSAFWVKLHYKPEAGIKNWNLQEATEISGKDPDYSIRDLYNTIASGEEVAWKAYAQIIPVEEAMNYKWNLFDITKVVPHGDYPLVEYGRLVLNRNPANFFNEVEQAAFSPANLVPGIEPSPDRMLQARLMSYKDTQFHRLGPNFMQIPVNAPIAPVRHQQRDGLMSMMQFGDEVNYEPNSVSGITKVESGSMFSEDYVQGVMAQHEYFKAHKNDDFEQPRNFWTKVLSPDERKTLVSNMVETLALTRQDIQDRLVMICTRVHEDFGSMLKKQLVEKKDKVQGEGSRIQPLKMTQTLKLNGPQRLVLGAQSIHHKMNKNDQAIDDTQGRPSEYEAAPSCT